MQKRDLMIRLRVATMLRLLATTAFLASPTVAMAQDFNAVSPGGTFPPPAATIDGFDPYSDPLSQQTPSLMPQGDMLTRDPFLDPGLQGSMFFDRFHAVNMFKFEYTFLNPHGTNQLGLNEGEISATFAFPLRPGLAPLLVKPGFNVQFWEGPSVPVMPAPDMPGQTYSAWLNVAWHPQITPGFAASLDVRPGVYSDFNTVTSRSIRIKGRGLGIFTLSPDWKIAAGAVYLDRNKVKVLPAGGFVWTPTDDIRWEILFPQPKLAQRIQTYGNTQVWWYVGGEYGGDAWTIRRNTAPGVTISDAVDYNDIRIYIGLEWKPCDALSGINGHLEVGYVFDRELVYLDTTKFVPTDTLMIRATLEY